MHLKLIEPKQSPKQLRKRVVVTHEAIATVAYKLYKERGGNELDNWLEAEAILKNKKL